LRAPGGSWRTAADLRCVGQIHTLNSISNEAAYVYLATGVELDEIRREPTELMEMRLVLVEEALRVAREGESADGPSPLALLWCESLFRPRAACTQPVPIRKALQAPGLDEGWSSLRLPLVKLDNVCYNVPRQSGRGCSRCTQM
jgi:hypothetical protein